MPSPRRREDRRQKRGRGDEEEEGEEGAAAMEDDGEWRGVTVIHRLSSWTFIDEGDRSQPGH